MKTSVYFLAGFLCLLLSISLWWQAGMMGMPDGYISEVDRAMRPILRLLSAASGIAALWALVTGVVARRRSYPKLAFMSLTLISACILAMWFERHLRTFLDYGQGG